MISQLCLRTRHSGSVDYCLVTAHTCVSSMPHIKRQFTRCHCSFSACQQTLDISMSLRFFCRTNVVSRSWLDYVKYCSGIKLGSRVTFWRISMKDRYLHSSPFFQVLCHMIHVNVQLLSSCVKMLSYRNFVTTVLQRFNHLQNLGYYYQHNEDYHNKRYTIIHTKTFNNFELHIVGVCNTVLCPTYSQLGFGYSAASAIPCNKSDCYWYAIDEYV